MRRSWQRHALRVLFLTLIFVVAACSGGGCSSGCSSCGMTPIPGGFPDAQLVTNAASIRVTRPGVTFLQSNIAPLAQKLLKQGSMGLIQYPVPMTSVSVPVVGNISICPNGPNPSATPLEQCTADVNLSNANLFIDSVTPDTITITGTIPVKVEELPVGGIPLIGTINVGLGTGSCNGNDPSVAYQNIPVDIELPLIAETIAPRQGFTKIDGANITVNIGLTSSDVTLCGCGALSFICDPALSAIQGFVFSFLQSSIASQLKSTVSKALCTAPVASQTPPCPAGSAPSSDNTECMYTASPSTCVPIELGLDGHMNLGSLLANLSPGTMGGLDILLASGGAMIPAPGSGPSDSPCSNDPTTSPYVPCHTPNGITLGFLGGALPQPQSTCVPTFANTIPDNIPIPDEMEQDKQTPWPPSDPTGPDLGIALAGRFLDYALGSVYNSGLLCLGVTTYDFQELNSGLLSVLIKSVKYLTFEQKPAAAAIVTRPQSPPTVKIGGGTNVNTDPLLLVTAPKFAIDFYIWSTDRFVRAFTFTADLTIPVNLETTTGSALLPVLGSVTAANGTVTNNELLLDDPATVATSLSAILGGIAGQLTGSLKAFDISSALTSYGLDLTIPSGGIRKLTKGTDDYVAIFADLGTTTMMMVKPHPQATLLGQVVHPEAMTLSTFDRSKLPELHVSLSSDAAAGSDVEYAWWIDQGTRSAWSPATDLTIQNDTLFLQAKHTLYVAARIVGHPESEDDTPAAVPFLIDVLPPVVNLSRTTTGVTVSAWDIVSDATSLEARTRVTDMNGNELPWSGWLPLASVAQLTLDDASFITVEVRDEAGNVGVSTDLIRGRPDPTLGASGSSCSCSMAGASDLPGHEGPAWALALGLAVLLASAMRRRASAKMPGRTAAAVGLGALALGGTLSQGCSCGATGHATETADAGDESSAMTGCGSDCNQMCGPSLPMGLVGAYTSIAQAADGTLWVAGYNDSAVTSAFSGLYGDLVVGKYDATKQLVAWQSVDGLPPPLPAGTCPEYDPTGWRQGQSDPANDVGLWTSIQLDANNNPMVSYYDATNQALKFASCDGMAWSSHTVSQTAGSDIGRYSKMLVVGGVPVIAFLVMEPGDMGKIRSKVTLATATIAKPTAGADWTFVDAAVDDDGPCRSSYCTGSDVCITETNSCVPPATGCADCGDAGASTVCVSVNGAPTCGTPIAASYIDIYPNAYADYISLASGPSGLGIVVYDRLHGNLVGVSKASGAWQTTILDGETGSRAPNSGPDGGISAVDTGDVGVGADLFIDSNGDWHVSYVNGSLETLQYLVAPKGAAPTSKPEVVDTGMTLGGQPFPDGQHIVGDDSSVTVSASGVITISYQDATVGTLRVATGTPGGAGGTHTWSIAALPQPNLFAGFFSHVVPGGSSVANWWRASDAASGSISGNVAFVTSP